MAGEVLVQFESALVGGANQQILGQQVVADQNVPVERRGLRRFRSRAFDVETLIAFFRAQPGVAFAEPNYIIRTAAIPNDPSFTSLWGLLNIGQPIFGFAGTPGADIDATAAWDVSTGSKTHVGGVIDSGIEHSPGHSHSRQGRVAGERLPPLRCALSALHRERSIMHEHRAAEETSIFNGHSVRAEGDFRRDPLMIV